MWHVDSSPWVLREGSIWVAGTEERVATIPLPSPGSLQGTGSENESISRTSCHTGQGSAAVRQCERK